jgi:SAM-dependent methyltransferase
MTKILLTTLTFGVGGNARPHLGAGWSRDEPAFVWAMGPESHMTLERLVPDTSYTLELALHPYVFGTELPSQRLSIDVNGEVLATYSVARGALLECEIPRHVAARSDRLNILFRHPDAATPAMLEDTNDARPLAFAFRQCRLFMDAAAILPVGSDYFVPPAELLSDGITTAEDFKRAGQDFTQVNLIARGRLQPHERVLDLGSGNGQKAHALTYYLNDKGSYEGLDIVKSDVEFCQQRYAILPNFRFQLADVYSSHYHPMGRYLDTEYRLPFSDGEFDLAFLSSVFTHMLPDGVANYIAQISRVLKPGGRCVATFFLLTRDSTQRIEAGVSSLDFKFPFGFYRVIDPRNPSKSVALDEEWVRDRFAAAGLRVVEATYGYWCGGKDLLGAYQDVLITVKE